MKFLKYLLLCILSLISLSFTSNAQAISESDFKIYLDNTPVYMRDKIYVENSRTFVPLRFISEKLKYEVIWDSKTGSITLTSDNDKLVFYINKKEVYVTENGRDKTVIIDAPPFIMNRRSYVPLRALENLSLIIKWEGSVKSIFLYNKNLYEKDSSYYDSFRTKVVNTKGIDKLDLSYFDKINNYSLKTKLSKETIERNNQVLLNSGKLIDISKYNDFNAVKKQMTLQEKAYSLKNEAASKNMNTASFTSLKNKSYAVAIRRCNLRRIADDSPLYVKGLDVNQETEIKPWTELMLVHQSLDKKYYYALTERYMGWVKASNIAFSDHNTISYYINAPSKVVVSAYDIKINNVKCDMGTTLPYIFDNDDSYTVEMPLKDMNGNLYTGDFSVSKNSSDKAYLPLSDYTLMEQAFKYLGKPYSFGGYNESTDCSGFVSNVYSVFNVKLPRNSGDMELINIGKKTSLKGMSPKEKKEKLLSSSIGSLVFTDGHVMMYIGKDSQNEPMLIHMHGKYKRAANIYPASCSITGLDIETMNGYKYVDLIRTIIEIK